MLNLKDFILESLTDLEMEDYVINALQDANRLRKAYRFLTRTEFPFKEYNEYLKVRGLTPSDGKQILRIFKDNDDDLDILLQIINKSESVVLPTSEEFLNYCESGQSLLDLFETTTKISRETLVDIASFTPAKKGVARGRYEILCCLLLQDIQPYNEGYGDKSSDINTIKTGNLEFKADGGRVKGHDLETPKLIDNKILSLVSEYFDSKNDKKELAIIKAGNIFTVKPKKKINNIQTVLNDIIVKRISERIPNDRELTKTLQQLLTQSIICQFGSNADERELSNFFEQIWSEIFDTQKKQFKSEEFSRVFGAIDTFFYQKSDGWAYMIVFDKKDNGKCTFISAQSISSIYSVWTNKKIQFTGYPEAGSPYGFAVHIHKA